MLSNVGFRLEIRRKHWSKDKVYVAAKNMNVDVQGKVPNEIGYYLR